MNENKEAKKAEMSTQQENTKQNSPKSSKHFKLIANNAKGFEQESVCVCVFERERERGNYTNTLLLYLCRLFRYLFFTWVFIFLTALDFSTPHLNTNI